jgi:hypothetical protein
MLRDPTIRRRWLGAAALVLALALLLAGETVLQNRLGGLALLGCWAACFVLTGLAMILAVRELQAAQRRIRDEQRELLQGALKEIEAEARARRRSPTRRPPR